MSSADVIAKDALAHLYAGRFDDAERLYRQILASQPNSASTHLNLALTLFHRDKLTEAEICCHKAIALEPDSADGYAQLGDILAARRKFTEAEQEYRKALAANPGIADTHNNLGNVLVYLGRTEEALDCYTDALKINPNLAEAHNSRGHVFQLQDHTEDAIKAFRAAIAIRPDYAESYNNLGVALCRQGQFAESMEACRKAIQIRPGYAEAYKNLGKSLIPTGELHEVEACFRQVVRIAPDYADGHRLLAMTLEEMGRLEEAFGHFRKHAELVYGADKPSLQHQTTSYMQRHDSEQQSWLGARAKPFLIGDGARVAGPAVNPANRRADISATWRTAHPQIVIVDDFLTPPALQKLYRFCVESTIWRKSYENGYLGALPEHGFATPLMAQIAEEMRSVFPAIIEDYPLLLFWAFKYDSELKGINVHADFAAVNVNFWITPDEANLDPGCGGIIVWDTAAPVDWNFTQYNGANDKIRDFLTRSDAKPLTVPYRANRAVIFDSDLFHETDIIRFKPGYENRRINVTLLFGRRLSQNRRAARHNF